MIEALWAESTDDRVFHKFSTQIQRELWKTPRFFRSQSPNSLYLRYWRDFEFNEIGKALRKETKMYPEIAIRELVANALVHQDFSEKGFPMVEIFTDRIEISNSGTPLVNPDRFIDAYVSRNEKMADLISA